MYRLQCRQEYENRIREKRQPVMLAAHIRKCTGKEVSPDVVRERMKKGDVDYFLKQVRELE